MRKYLRVTLSVIGLFVATTVETNAFISVINLGGTSSSSVFFKSIAMENVEKITHAYPSSKTQIRQAVDNTEMDTHLSAMLFNAHNKISIL